MKEKKINLQNVRRSLSALAYNAVTFPFEIYICMCVKLYRLLLMRGWRYCIVDFKLIKGEITYR